MADPITLQTTERLRIPAGIPVFFEVGVTIFDGAGLPPSPSPQPQKTIADLCAADVRRPATVHAFLPPHPRPVAVAGARASRPATS